MMNLKIIKEGDNMKEDSTEQLSENLEYGNTEYVITKAGRDYIKQLEKCLEERKSDTVDEKLVNRKYIVDFEGEYFKITNESDNEITWFRYSRDFCGAHSVDDEEIWRIWYLIRSGNRAEYEMGYAACTTDDLIDYVKMSDTVLLSEHFILNDMRYAFESLEEIGVRKDDKR